MTQSIETKIDENNIITVAIIGDLLEDKMDNIVSSLKDSVKIITDAYDNAGQKKVKVLVDLSNFDGKYAIKSFTHMVNYAIQTDQYVEKSAVFGGNDKEKMAAEMVIALSHRDNIKIFDTKEEAMEWLVK
ncbi:MAG: hypothetical protein A3F47_01575 [Candidatus Staskawiczbacteria bacterium RIFCSPHIGHO2_12_FULL_38_11]|uniref:STAS/SEC14 domain-containing protein n=1 Tax=Candidatus Staskawiczbacteria bacterium RIFCSPHIGHO2_12_FULL_38_11 TaxID=1802209 RepID=A0A1G2I6M9_9BACT|nr:MAG: hypothetical protein A3F47_01575 [Candidatus Staskawiczbacteria bacterium RIFCSPHIGHO2_12_FULL_38_11]